ncbi:anti-mullerian hormone type 1 [Arapaima gigas]
MANTHNPFQLKRRGVLPEKIALFPSFKLTQHIHHFQPSCFLLMDLKVPEWQSAVLPRGRPMFAAHLQTEPLLERNPEGDQVHPAGQADRGAGRKWEEDGEEEPLSNVLPKPLESSPLPPESVHIPVPEQHLRNMLLWGVKEENTAVMKKLHSKLKEAARSGVELDSKDKEQFGVCSDLDRKPSGQIATLFALAQRFARDEEQLFILHPTKELWDVDGEVNRAAVILHFHLPHSLRSICHRLTTMLLLFVQSSISEGVLSVSFASHSLQPHQQTACLSAGTQFIILSGGTVACSTRHQLAWEITVETTHGNKEPKQPPAEVQQLLRGDEPGDDALSPLLLLLADRKVEQKSDSTEPSEHTASWELSPTAALLPSETFLFLCELQIFLNEALSQTQLEPVAAPAPSVSLGSLTSLPSMSLGSSSTEALLLGLLNSSAPTLFSFPSSTAELQAHRVQLALEPHLLSVLKLRLEEALGQIHREEAGGRGVKDRLLRLQELSALPVEDDKMPAGETGLVDAGGRQYHAVLLLKALQTVLQGWEAERGQRATRGGQEGQGSGGKCRLHPLTVSMDKHLLSPTMATINNCQGSCSDLPLEKITNHAMMLNIHRSSGLPLERSPCCVPVVYEELCVAVLNSEGTEIQYKPDMVAKECGCR